MSDIGKPLVFYLKYFPEMQQAYEEDRNFPGVDPAKVKVAGDSACVEAENLLRACTADWFSRLEKSKVAIFKHSKPATVRRNWAIEIDVRPRGQKSSTPLKHQMGLCLERDELIPWVWSRGGVAIEEKIRGMISPETITFGSKASGLAGGSLAISPVEIPWDRAKEFKLGADEIIKQTKNALEAISPELIAALLKL
jgi:hypothetical protein